MSYSQFLSQQMQSYFVNDKHRPTPEECDIFWSTLLHINEIGEDGRKWHDIPFSEAMIHSQLARFLMPAKIVVVPGHGTTNFRRFIGPKDEKFVDYYYFTRIADKVLFSLGCKSAFNHSVSVASCRQEVTLADVKDRAYMIEDEDPSCMMNEKWEMPIPVYYRPFERFYYPIGIEDYLKRVMIHWVEELRKA